jgi:squalene cyclase
VLRKTQRADGSWEGPCDMGPVITAQAVVVLHHLRQLTSADAAQAARWLRTQQRPDGSFVLYPTARAGHVGATASAWAALHLTAPDESRDAIARARSFIEKEGGLDRIVDGIQLGDFSALFLAMAGLLDARRLKKPSIAFMAVPGAVQLLRSRLSSGAVASAFELSTLIRTLRKEPLSLADRLAHAKGIEILSEFQNPDGSWNDSVVISILGLASLGAAGVAVTDPRMQRGLRWFEAQAIRGPTGLHFNGFGSEVWATAFDVRGLLDAGVAPSNPAVARALGFLADAQSFRPMPAIDNRKRGAVRTGGFAFQRSNPTMVDNDDTGVVLSAFGAALRWSGHGALDSALEARLERAVRQAQDWLLDMQNPDGGWAAFIWGLPSKRPGPALQRTLRLGYDNLLQMAQLVIDPPMQLGDPSTEDVTARVLHGLGATGFSVRSTAVQNALAFLQRQQCQSGAFWGRWVCNYLSCTAFVLMGVRSVGAERDADWVRRAVHWVLSKQNADGGWGETPASYPDESKAGVGPSMPPLTALVLKGLLDIGERSAATDRAAAYLVASQHSDGSWPNNDYLHVNIAPDTFYLYEEPARFYPLMGLGTWANKGGAVKVTPPRYTSDGLEAMRQHGDPVADKVVKAVFARGQVAEVDNLLGRLFAAAATLPADLPAEVKEYLEKGRVLPDWADAGRIATAQQLFTRHGWSVAAGLFCSSLPQAYCAANGAHVLMQSQRMTTHVKRRIFETAQFLFDTCDEGALGPKGPGIDAALKVRLMHAAIRHLVLARSWDVAVFGLPVNQEDLAGTLMTFSIVILQALPRLGVELQPGEGEAWLHLWQVLGHLLGVSPDLVPNDIGEGEQLMDLIRARQWARSADGLTLARYLIELMQQAVPGRALDGIPVALVRRLAGDHAADLLGLPRADWTTVLLNAMGSVAAADLDDELTRSRVFAEASHLVMRGVVEIVREGRNAKFRMPSALVQQKK